MWTFPIAYDVIVIGGGHAGCEAALASARMGAKTLLLTTNLDTIGKMSCNPAVGGVGKGHMVREIDALGGEMGKATEAAAIQLRMLNRSKGPAVWAPRAQADKMVYQIEMKRRLEVCPNLSIKQATAEEFITKESAIVGVRTKEGIFFPTRTAILASGTFMRGLLHLGDTNFSGGRAGDSPSVGLSASLESLGLKLGRLKTGTPPRLHMRSIDYSQAEEQPGEEGIRFSFDEKEKKGLPQVSCHIAYTTAETRKIIQDNLHLSPIYSGKIQSIGPRYCPSIEDKVVRFADKERHQIFLEPEGLNTQEVYVNGLSTSLPPHVQLAFLQSIPALRHAEITRPGYAVEYDYVISGQINQTLETREIGGLFLAGQINGTTGYEEAAAQGLLAGINAACQVSGREPLILGRNEAYIAVMIDDLINKGVDEPYRMFTSRAEYRLLLRQDNADLRLRHHGRRLGLISDKQMAKVSYKQQTIDQEMTRLASCYRQIDGKGTSLAKLLSRPEMSYEQLIQEHPDAVFDHGEEINLQITCNIKYQGYIERQKSEIAKLGNLERIKISSAFDYKQVVGLRFEAQQKLGRIVPENLAQAARIPGVSPADISVLMVALTAQAR